MWYLAEDYDRSADKAKENRRLWSKIPLQQQNQVIEENLNSIENCILDLVTFNKSNVPIFLDNYFFPEDPIKAIHEFINH